MLLGKVAALFVLYACPLLLSTHGWVCARVGGLTQIHDRKYKMIRTIDAKVLNRNGPNGANGANIFVQNGDAAHNSGSKRQVIDYISEAGPGKFN